MNPTTERRNDKVANLVDQLHRGIADLVTGDDWQHMMAVAARFHRYSSWNTIAIFVQRPEATVVGGYRTWQQLGRHVRRGERGIAILAPCTYRTNSAGNDNAEPPDEPGRTVLRGFKVVHVFDVDQTEGEPLTQIAPALLQGDAPASLLDSLVASISAAGFTFERGPMPAPYTQANGITAHDTRRVVVRHDLAPAQAAKTTAHELAHVLLHGPDRPAQTRDRAEVEAESVAYVVCAACGVDTDTYTFPYVSHWAKGDLDLVRATAERVMACARRILDDLPVPSDIDSAEATA